MRIEEKNGTLSVVDFDAFDALRIACEIEKDGVWLYEKIKNSIKDEQIKRAFEFLIGEEKKHLSLFEDLVAQLRTTQDDVNEEDDLLSSMDFGIFQPYQSLAELENIVTSPTKALRLGVLVEDKSIQFYQACSQKVSDAGSQTELVGIIGEEKKHKALLQKILDGLDKNPR